MKQGQNQGMGILVAFELNLGDRRMSFRLQKPDCELGRHQSHQSMRQ